MQWIVHSQDLINAIGLVSGILSIVLAAVAAIGAGRRTWKRKRSTDSGRAAEDATVKLHSSRRDRPPPALKELFDRRADLESCTRLLRRRARLVTIVGPAGIGKTTLAEMAARSAKVREFRQVDLANQPNPALLSTWIAQQVGAPATSDPVDALERRFRSARAVLMLDGCDQVVEALAPLVQRLLARCPKLQVLATSQRPLGLLGLESVVRISGLEEGSDVSLFLARARAGGTDLQPTSEERDLIASFCGRVGRWPLAIELVAAHAGALPLRQLVTDVDGILALEVGGMSEVHRSLHASMSFSYQLLPVPAAELAARISVFQSPATLDAIREVCWDGPLNELPKALAELVSKSWLQFSADRYSTLVPVARWLESQLGTDAGLVKARHLDYMHRLVESRVETISGRGPADDAERRATLNDLDLQRLDYWAALAYAQTLPEPAREISLVLALWPYWSIRGLLLEARYSIEAALKRVAADTADMATLLNAAGEIARYQGRFHESLGSLDRSYAIRVRLTDEMGQGDTLNNRGDVRLELGDVEEAERDYQASLSLRQTGQISLGVGYCKANLAHVACLRGKYQDGRELASGALQVFTRERYQPGEAYARIPLALALAGLGEVDKALDHATLSVAAFLRQGYLWNIAQGLEAMVVIDAGASRLEEAARLQAAADGLRTEIGAPRSEFWQRRLQTSMPHGSVAATANVDEWRAVVADLTSRANAASAAV